MNNDTAPSPHFDRPVTVKVLREQWGIPYGDSQLLRLEREGKFPRRFKLGGRVNAWLESELAAWIKERAASRDTATVAV
ncbi:helix-turn-helix transcriptional regulator [Luteibacter sp.]|uniref:helix-turn-helix transcriptional regulator n=1 Tax=Luteibacter sp. TaxID=1886636 RepID=UPI003F7D730C